jgi:hypothetical protein
VASTDAHARPSGGQTIAADGGYTTANLLGYPMVNVRDIESGKVRATRELFGAD